MSQSPIQSSEPDFNPATELRADLNLRLTPKEPTRNIIPQIHEMELSFPIPDLSLYHQMIAVWGKEQKNTDKVGRKYIPFNIQGKDFRMWSHVGGLKIPGTENLAFEYHLSYQDSKGNQKISYHIHPTFGAGTRTKEGKILNLPKATNVKVNSSYFEPKDIFSIFRDFLYQTDSTRFTDMINPEKGRISALAFYVRYNEKKEYLTKMRFETINKYAPTKGVYKFNIERHDGDLFYGKIVPPDWEFCGFQFPFGVGLKSYRIRRFEERVKEDPLRHPKLEVSLTKNETKEYPTINQFDSIKEKLTEFILSVVQWCGIKEDDFIEDDYFKKAFEDKYVMIRPWIESEEDRTANEHEKFLNELPIGQEKAMDILAHLSLHEYESLKGISEAVNLSIRQCSRYIDELITKGILDKMVEEQAYIFWKSHNLREKFLEAIRTLSPFNIPGIGKLWGATQLNPARNELIRDSLKSLINRVNKTRKGAYNFFKKPEAPVLEIPKEDIREYDAEMRKDFKKKNPKAKIALIHTFRDYIPASVTINNRADPV